MNLEGRVEKLEAQVDEKEMDVSDISLYDINGEQVNAKILRMPTDWECGLAIFPDGTEKEIACEGNWRDIIFGTEKYLDEIGRDNYKPDPDSVEKAYADKLFIRINGKISACEALFGGR